MTLRCLSIPRFQDLARVGPGARLRYTEALLRGRIRSGANSYARTVIRVSHSNSELSDRLGNHLLEHTLLAARGTTFDDPTVCVRVL